MSTAKEGAVAVRFRGARRVVRTGLMLTLTLLAGCYTVEFHETTYPVALTPYRTGPGGAEGELAECVGLQEDAYSGEKISIGLFPGWSFFVEGLGAGTVGGSVVYAVWAPIANVFLAVPTLCTLLVEPFMQGEQDRKVKDGDVIALGLVGAFRWKSLPHVETEEEYRELVLVDGRYKVDVARIPRMESSDGTPVYLEYPGFRALKEDVDAHGQVDVVFADGSRIRRFVPSEREANRLVFEDRDIATEPDVGLRYFQHLQQKSRLLKEERQRYEQGKENARE